MGLLSFGRALSTSLAKKVVHRDVESSDLSCETTFFDFSVVKDSAVQKPTQLQSTPEKSWNFSMDLSSTSKSDPNDPPPNGESDRPPYQPPVPDQEEQEVEKPDCTWTPESPPLDELKECLSDFRDGLQDLFRDYCATPREFDFRDGLRDLIGDLQECITDWRDAWAPRDRQWGCEQPPNELNLL